MIATPSIPGSVLASRGGQAGVPLGNGGYQATGDPLSSSFSVVLQQSAAEPEVEQSASSFRPPGQDTSRKKRGSDLYGSDDQVSVLPGHSLYVTVPSTLQTGVDNHTPGVHASANQLEVVLPAGVSVQHPASELALRLKPLAVAIAEKQPASTVSLGSDVQAPLVYGDRCPIVRPFTPQTRVEDQTRVTYTFTEQPGSAFSAVLPAPRSAFQREFRVDWKDKRDGSDAELTSAPRLKPFAAPVIEEQQGAPTDSPGPDVQAPSVSSSRLPVFATFTQQTGMKSPARSTYSFNDQSGGRFPAVLTGPASAIPKEFRVEWSNNRAVSSSELAFALRLKALGSEKQGPSTYSRDLDSQASPVSRDGRPIAPTVTPQTGVENPPEVTHLSAGHPNVAFPTELLVPASAIPKEFRVEWGNIKNGGASADLAFALRLKPLAPVVTAEKQGAAVPASRGPEAKNGETSDGIPGNLPALQSGNEPSADTPGGNQDSSRRNHAATTRRPGIPGQPEHTEKVEVPAPLESVIVHPMTERSPVTSLVHAAMGPAVVESPAPSKAQPAVPPPATRLDAEDQPATVRPAKEISLQISSGGDHTVDVRLVERGGEVHVSVRTPDVGLAHEMRQDLGSLTGKLAQSGFGTEQFTPLTPGSSSLSDPRNAQENRSPSHGHGQDPQQGGSGQQQQPQDERGKRPAWAEEMENTLAPRQANRSTRWLFNR